MNIDGTPLERCSDAQLQQAERALAEAVGDRPLDLSDDQDRAELLALRRELRRRQEASDV